ncbi:MAG: pantoate--beta-alanine ligase [Ferruginibacter sp.]
MIICKTRNDINTILGKMRTKGKTTGFVPTMGALHQGHISLINTAKKQCAIVVSSIFVNPTQFNDPKDFEKYPVTLEKDIEMLEAAGCDVLFLPAVNEMYPDGLGQKEFYDLGFLETILEGKFRPGHFQGVCQVVERLFRIVNADYSFFGQKDYQQCMVIKKLVELKQLETTIVICPTQRETNGLAMSSRNMRLSEQERSQATVIYQTMTWIKDKIKNGEEDLSLIKEDSRQTLISKGFKPDYVEIANADTLEALDKPMTGIPIVILIAAFLGDVRLIDNMVAGS